MLKQAAKTYSESFDVDKYRELRSNVYIFCMIAARKDMIRLGDTTLFFLIKSAPKLYS